ncbi:YafY family protein [Lachnospiraceae bacterium 54-53]
MKTDRLISIIMVLLNCDKISASKLAELLEVSTRTIYRDVEAIGKAGIPIFATAGVDGGIGILPEYKVDKNVFTPSDIQTILMGLSSVSTAFSSKEVTGTLEKIKSLMPEPHSLRASQITVDLTPWMGNKSFPQRLGRIRQSLNENRLLRFSYYSKNREHSLRRIEPYQLVLKETHWYLHGYCLEKQDFRVFRLSRMSDVIIENQTFIPKEFSPRPMDGSGWMEKKLIPATLLIDDSLYERLAEIGGEDRITPYGDGRFLVEFLFAPDDYGYNLLLGFGDKCECVGPPEVRKELKKRIENLLDRYR